MSQNVEQIDSPGFEIVGFTPAPGADLRRKKQPAPVNRKMPVLKEVDPSTPTKLGIRYSPRAIRQPPPQRTGHADGPDLRIMKAIMGVKGPPAAAQGDDDVCRDHSGNGVVQLRKIVTEMFTALPMPSGTAPGLMIDFPTSPGVPAYMVLYAGYSQLYIDVIGKGVFVDNDETRARLKKDFDVMKKLMGFEDVSLDDTQEECQSNESD